MDVSGSVDVRTRRSHLQTSSRDTLTGDDPWGDGLSYRVSTDTSGRARHRRPKAVLRAHPRHQRIRPSGQISLDKILNLENFSDKQRCDL